jgi:hypothetical protein
MTASTPSIRAERVADFCEPILRVDAIPPPFARDRGFCPARP